jgi:SAM-dependent methyltransferase
LKGRPIERSPEPEVMDERQEVEAYREADFSEVNTDFVRRALKLAGTRGRAIDLGTGPAEIPRILCRLSPGWRVVAVDASREMLREARAALADGGLGRRVRLLLGDAKRLGRVRGGFDLVMSNSLLHHLTDPVPFWREAARLAGSRGAVLIQDLARPPTRQSARRLVEKHTRGSSRLLRELFHRSLLAAYTPDEVRGQLRSAGVRGLCVRMVSDRHLEVRGRPSRLPGGRGAGRTRGGAAR